MFFGTDFFLHIIMQAGVLSPCTLSQVTRAMARQRMGDAAAAAGGVPGTVA